MNPLKSSPFKFKCKNIWIKQIYNLQKVAKQKTKNAKLITDQFYQFPYSISLKLPKSFIVVFFNVDFPASCSWIISQAMALVWNQDFDIHIYTHIHFCSFASPIQIVDDAFEHPTAETACIPVFSRGLSVLRSPSPIPFSQLLCTAHFQEAGEPICQFPNMIDDSTRAAPPFVMNKCRPGPPLEKCWSQMCMSKSWLSNESHCLANDPRARARKINIKKHDYETLCMTLYGRDGLHPSRQGSQHLMFNIRYAVLSTINHRRHFPLNLSWNHEVCIVDIRSTMQHKVAL